MGVSEEGTNEIDGLIVHSFNDAFKEDSMTQNEERSN